MVVATDPLSLVFIGCFLFGLLFLLATVLLGSIGHGHGMSHSVGHGTLHHVHAGGPVHHHSAPTHQANVRGESKGSGSSFSLLTILNPSSVVFFLLGFGFFGYIFHHEVGLGLSLTLLLSILSGCLIAAMLITLINRLIGSTEAHTIQDVSDRTGLVGKVILTIQGNDPGEILYQSPGGLRKSIPARSFNGQRIERGEEVVVVNFNKGVAEVDTWQHFIEQEEIEPEKSLSTQDIGSLRALLEEAENTHEKSEEAYLPSKDQQKQEFR